MKVKPIEPQLRPLLTQFLEDKTLQPKFLAEARKLGYTGDDPEKIKVPLFTPNTDNEICFANNDIYDMFVEYQIAESLFKSGVPRDLAPEVFAQLILECKDYLDDLHNESIK